ncbi:hypothetical protein BO94DRAFT_457358 [Aspergillus sclerotioniger CBS 115572]|uniref:Uncharacterized protein n=1 Tax=Aspergillus sclerotioniger CBS 115572 TaxID=1450535 RepID=A0A317X949_9EURO|nr:hypothetical protein BO94DRAFT_457358 [Aspergillus sclerotioniger CBS 115572]PWY94865.1 hypothetical protein BO94DRAFT_457358 [Aspergillus sclerotioniger CBS 115572]
MENRRAATASTRGAAEAGARLNSSEFPTLDWFGPSAATAHDDHDPPRPALSSSPLSSALTATVPFPLINCTATAPLDRRTRSEPCIPGIISASTSPPGSKASFVRGHRRRSTHVTRRDLEKFRKDVLGLETSGFGFDDDHKLPPPDPALDPEFKALNNAFEAASMSLNSGGMAGSSPGSAMFASYGDNSGGASSMNNVPRQSMSPAMPHTPAQVNGGGMPGMNGGVPMNAGHQMDLHHLYDMVLELSDVLKNNREMTKSIATSAEEIMKRSSTEGTSPNLQQVNGEITGARIAELERAIAKERRLTEILKTEQAENAKLIGEYEATLGTMVEQIRNYCQNNNMHYLSQKRHYNNLLQAERDSHLESRLDRDYWHAQTMKCAEMIRTAYRLRSEEEELPIRIVAGLQNEVRAYRNALGMEPERPEDEYGWEILKDIPGSAE